MRGGQLGGFSVRPLMAIFASLLLSSPAFAQARPVVVEDAWVRVYAGDVSLYFHILNNGAEPDRLLGVSTPVAAAAQLTRTRIRSGKFSYLPLASLEIGGFEAPRLRPGGTHVRLSELKRDLRVGDMIPLTLRFERSGTVEVTARVGNQLLGNR